MTWDLCDTAANSIRIHVPDINNRGSNNMSSLGGVPTSPFVCSSNVRSRMSNLATIYLGMIDRGELSREGASRSDVSIRLMLDGFKTSPTFHLTEALRRVFPVHCWHLDLLTLHDISSTPCESILTYIGDRTKTCDHLLYAFLQHSGSEEFSDGSFLRGVFEVFRGIGRDAVGSSVGGLLAAAARHLQIGAALGISHNVNTFYDPIPTPAALLFARAVAWLFVASDVCSAADRQVVFQCMDGVLRHDAASRCLVSLFSHIPADVFGKLVDEMQVHLTVALYSEVDHAHLDRVCLLMSHLNAANYKPAPRDGIVPHVKFYNPFTDEFDEEHIRDDFIRLHQGQFAFARFPFLVNPRYKSILLQFEAAAERHGAYQDAMISSILSRQGSRALEEHFLVLNIDRHNLVASTLSELRSKSSGHLRRPMRIQFVGEEGVDEGGLKKEFFQLVTRALMHPDFNMFYTSESSRLMWFVPEVQNASNAREFFLIGQLIGLAVYNNIIVDISFPMAVYRKLLNVPVTLDDLRDLDPSMHHGLTELLQFEEVDGVTVEDVFCRSFTYEHDVFGQKIEVPMIEGGETQTLTSSNRREFAEVLCHYVLTKSIASNFNAFRDGFLSVCTRGMFTHLRPEELEHLVCGSRELDFAEMESSTSYEGFDADDPSIKLFWSAVHNFDNDQKRKFLRFCTGSDRIPVGGLRDLHFVIGKNGDDSELLPTAHTCFNHLLLPAYATEDKMRMKILLAIENCEGFYGGR